MRGKGKAPMDEIGAKLRMNLDVRCLKDTTTLRNTQPENHCYRPCRARVLYRIKKARWW